jgi:protein-disulfide isomerase
MSKTETKQSGLPVIIIVLVGAVALFLAWWYYNSSVKTKAVSPTPTPVANKTQGVPTNAPLGAVPPNFSGSQNALVTVEEFADFQCPSCGLTHPVMKQIQQIYGTRINFIFRNYPLPMHDKAYDASVSAEAAGLQGSEKFWAMHNQLYTNQSLWSSDPNYKQVFRSYAEKIGLDMSRWDNDVAGLQAKTRVDADVARGKALNVNSTPSVYINGKSVPYPDMNVATLRQLIDADLQAAAPNKGAAAAAPPAANTNTNQQ